jgi:hypothetical protein
LIVAYATSLYDENGERQDEFALEEIIGVRPRVPDEFLKDNMYKYSTKIGGPSDLYLLARDASVSLLSDYWKNRRVPAWYYEPVSPLRDDQVIMDIVTGDGHKPLLPAVVLSPYENGKVLYSAVSLESLFLKDGKYVIKELLGQFVNLVSSQNLPYSLEAPSFLISNLAYNDDHWVLHMTNWTGNKYERPYVDETYLAPVENVELTMNIPEGKSIRSVQSFLDMPYQKEIVKNKVIFTIPRVEAYQGIQIDFE